MSAPFYDCYSSPAPPEIHQPKAGIRQLWNSNVIAHSLLWIWRQSCITMPEVHQWKVVESSIAILSQPSPVQAKAVLLVPM